MKHKIISFSLHDSKKRIEAIFFLILTLVNLLPILSGAYFPTLDGPAHLYNANVINELWSQNHSVFNDFYAFNQELVPNWTSHVLLAFLCKMMPAFMAEKVVLIGFLIAFPFAFRSLIKTIAPDNGYLSFLIFPFTYTYFFFLGFYNFSIALLLLLLILNYWIRQYPKKNTIKQLIVLSFGITLMYFSHIFVFAILLMSLGIFIIAKGFQKLLLKEQSTKEIILFSFKKAGVLLFSSAFPLLLFVQYFVDRQSVGGEVYLNHQELMDGLTQMRSLITLNVEIESIQTKRITLGLTALIIVGLFFRFRSKKEYPAFEKTTSNILLNRFKLSDCWLILAAIMLFLYFVLPDSNADAGYVSPRIALLFFIFIVIWIAAQKMPKWIALPIVFLILFVQYKRVLLFRESVNVLNPFAVEYVKVSNLIQEKSIVLPINHTNNWLFGHFSNYLGMKKPVILLENYECDQSYFPLTWNKSKIPTPLLGTTKIDRFPKLDWKNPSDHQTIPVDYVFFMGNYMDSLNPLETDIDSILKINYKQIYFSSKCSLFELKKR